MTSTVNYIGGLRTESTHIDSGTKITTDAPLDNHGKGEAFSPTDMVANSLATCMLTVMGIKANAMNVIMDGSSAEITKIMSAEPRMISKIIVVVKMNCDADEKTRTILERTATTCPVNLSLNPAIDRDVTFEWK